MDLSELFTPFHLGPLRLPNRFVMAPMTRQRSPNGAPGDDVAAYYARRAEGGVGLIITEGTTIDDPSASPDPAIPEFRAETATAWKRVRDSVHAGGGRIMPQLWHLGVARRPAGSPRPDHASISPSGLARPGKTVGEPLSEERIWQVIDSFARSAHLAFQLGFDGVELHGAHGYLIDQFFWDGTNQRRDSWGGDLADRTRFATETIRAVRKATSPAFPIILRWSQWKMGDYDIRIANSPQMLERFLQPLADAGLTAFHCSTRRFWEPAFPESGSPLNLAGWTKSLTGLPTITVGSIGLSRADSTEGRMDTVSVSVDHLQALARRLAAGEFDLVAIGRALLANPRWVELVRDGRIGELQPYTAEAILNLS